MGTAADMRAMAEALDKVKGSLVAGYAARSGRDPEDIAALMAAETWFDAKDALDAGLATRIAEPVRMAARFDIARFRNAPPALVEAVVTEADPAETVPDGNGSENPDADIVGNDDDVSRANDPVPEPDSGSTDIADANLPPADGGSCGATADAPPDASAIRAQAIAHARAVVDLCRLAGQPQMAGRFLERDTSLDEVRAALLAAKAEATPEITPHHPQPGRSTTARPWGDVIARTFKMKG